MHVRYTDELCSIPLCGKEFLPRKISLFSRYPFPSCAHLCRVTHTLVVGGHLDILQANGNAENCNAGQNMIPSASPFSILWVWVSPRSCFGTHTHPNPLLAHSYDHQPALPDQGWSYQTALKKHSKCVQPSNLQYLSGGGIKLDILHYLTKGFVIRRYGGHAIMGEVQGQAKLCGTQNSNQGGGWHPTFRRSTRGRGGGRATPRCEGILQGPGTRWAAPRSQSGGRGEAETRGHRIQAAKVRTSPKASVHWKNTLNFTFYLFTSINNSKF